MRLRPPKVPVPEGVGFFSVGNADATYVLAASATFKVVKFDTAEANPEGWFSTTSFRYTPKLAGWYEFRAAVMLIDQIVSGERLMVSLFKNGSEWKRLWDQEQGVTTLAELGGGSCYAPANGSTDYFEIQAMTTANFSRRIQGSTGGGSYFTFFQGKLITQS